MARDSQGRVPSVRRGPPQDRGWARPREIGATPTAVAGRQEGRGRVGPLEVETFALGAVGAPSRVGPADPVGGPGAARAPEAQCRRQRENFSVDRGTNRRRTSRRHVKQPSLSSVWCRRYES